MARPVNADSGRTRGRILEVAGAMVSNHGIDGVSIRDIARESGVTLATVHHYFGTKDSLYEACIEEMYREMAALKEALAPAFGSGRDLADVVEEVVRTAFRFAVERQPTQRLLMRTVVERGLSEDKRENVLRPFLEDGSKLLAALSEEKTAYELRFVLQSLTYLMMRYSIAHDAELEIVADVVDREVALERIEDHLVGVAFALLGLERKAAPKKRAPAATKKKRSTKR